MATKLNNIKFELFSTKDHYLAFRQSWKDYINSGYSKPEYIEDSYGATHKVSTLTSAHHLLFYILIEKDLSVVFAPGKNLNKAGFKRAYDELKYLIKNASIISAFSRNEILIPAHIPEDRHQQYIDRYKNRIDNFMKPFGNSVTYEMLAALHELIREFNVLTNLTTDVSVTA